MSLKNYGLERFGGGRLAPTWRRTVAFSLAWSAGSVLYHLISGDTLESIFVSVGGWSLGHPCSYDMASVVGEEGMTAPPTILVAHAR